MDTFRYDDGEEADARDRDPPGRRDDLPFDGERIWLVRQPREPVGEQALLELPAGKLDATGEELEDAPSASWPRRSARARATGATW